MSPVTHAEHVAADLEANASYRDIWHHGFLGKSALWKYAAAADAVALELSNNPGTRTLIALRANLAHLDSGRAPRPSSKAGRAALRALNLLGRARRRGHETAANLIFEATSDVVADAFLHAYDTHSVEPDEIERLHDLRLQGRFPSHITADIRQLVFLVGDLLALADAYGWAEEGVIYKARDVFDDERPADADAA
ncbi:hypothetical protein [Streptomyces sp. NPDC001536]|uniref:hypothetical protein n=1 Tax=Streptomyces sp. NPDC001536 TaxID=3364583 RepID=UPI0036B7A3CE